MKIETQVGLFVFVAIGIFFYLSFNIGALRFDSSSYLTYRVYFDDTRGLEKKSNVKIAGVPVGRVEQRSLLDNGVAEVVISVHKSHKLFRNSYATITSDGLIGGCTLEIDPGDSSSGVLPPGSNLSMPGKTVAGVGDLMESAKEITDSIQDVISAFHSVFATPEGERLLDSGFHHVVNASKKLSEFSVNLDDVIRDNNQQIKNVCENMSETSDKLRNIIVNLQSKAKDFTSNIIDASESLKAGGEKLERTLENTEKLTDKVMSGEGSLGKLITDDSLFSDVKDAVGDVKKMVSKANQLTVSLDMGFYTCYPTGNKRGSVEAKLATESDYYYSLQIASDSFGPITRKSFYSAYYDRDINPIDTDDASLSPYQKARVPALRTQLVQSPDSYFVGIQICKKFNDLTLRVGLHENQMGVGVDYDFPVQFKSFRWTINLDIFDLQGRNRINDTRPHVTFANKVFFMRNAYTYLGFDDIFSKANSSFCWGLGFAFDDDDIKYLLSYLPLGKIA